MAGQTSSSLRSPYMDSALRRSPLTADDEDSQPPLEFMFPVNGLGAAAAPRSPGAHQLTLWDLPDEMVLSVLAFLDARTLSHAMLTSRRLYDLGKCRFVQQSITFAHLWPTPATSKFFERASMVGNLEASIKLGVALQYGDRLDANPQKAGEAYVRAETKSAVPFTWLLIRPPWPSQTCGKATILAAMTDLVEERGSRLSRHLAKVAYCAGKIASLECEGKPCEDETFLSNAAESGCGEAAVEMYLQLRSHYGAVASRRLQLPQLLRDDRFLHHFLVQRTLCEELASRGSLSKHAEEAQQRIRRLVGSGSRNVTVAGIEQPDLDRRGQMRYILIDWLIEVVDLKHFGHETVFLTVQLIDRFLERQAITRQDLQLIGVASMVIAARYLEKEIITIREAAWLTDSTFRYMEVVRAVGDILSLLGHQLVMPTRFDYLRIYQAVSKLHPDQLLSKYMSFVAELSLLHVPFGRHPPALIGAAVYFVAALILQGPDEAWPVHLQLATGLKLGHFVEVATAVFSQCFHNTTIDSRYFKRTGERLVETRFKAASGRTVDSIPTMQQFNQAVANCLFHEAAANDAEMDELSASLRSVDIDEDDNKADTDADANQDKDLDREAMSKAEATSAAAGGHQTSAAAGLSSPTTPVPPPATPTEDAEAAAAPPAPAAAAAAPASVRPPHAKDRPATFAPTARGAASRRVTRRAVLSSLTNVPPAGGVGKTAVPAKPAKSPTDRQETPAPMAARNPFPQAS